MMAHEFTLPYFPHPLFELFDLLRGILFNEAAVDRGDAHTPSGEDGSPSGSAGGGGDPDPDEKDSGKGDAKADGEASADSGTGEAEDGDGDKAPILIPKHRYDSASQRARDAEAQNAELRQELDTLRNRSGAGQGEAGGDAPTIDEQLTDLDRKIEQARADNNIDEVVRLGKEQRAIERGMYEEIAASKSGEASKQAREQIKLDSVIDSIEAEDPRFNPDAKEFDQELVDDVVDLQEGFVASGKYTPAQAMRRARAILAPPAQNDTGDKPAPRTTDVKKNLDAAKNIAPDTSDKGENSDKGGDIQDPSQVGEMNMDEFDALPEETKKRLRGDFV